MLRNLRIPTRYLIQTSYRPIPRLIPNITYRPITMSAPAAAAPAAAPAEGRLHKDEVTGEMVSKSYVILSSYTTRADR
jgi:hypothetical protein